MKVWTEACERTWDATMLGRGHCLGQGEGGCFKSVSKSHWKLEELHLMVSHIQQHKMYWCVCHLGLWVLETLTWLCCGYHRDYQWVYMWGHILEHQMSIRGSLLPKRAQEPNGSWTWPSHMYKLLGWLWWAVSEIIECSHPELSKIGEESWIMYKETRKPQDRWPSDLGGKRQEKDVRPLWNRGWWRGHRVTGARVSCVSYTTSARHHLFLF